MIYQKNPLSVYFAVGADLLVPSLLSRVTCQLARSPVSWDTSMAVDPGDRSVEAFLGLCRGGFLELARCWIVSWPLPTGPPVSGCGGGLSQWVSSASIRP